MLYGVVDIGSNTVKLNIYDIFDGDSKFILTKKYPLGLVVYIKHNRLSDVGISKLLDVIGDIKDDLFNLNILKFDMFATASLRNISNSNEVIAIIKKKLNIDIEILEFDEEAAYGFLGSLSSFKYDSGILIDVGGGSSEIVIFEGRSIKNTHSLPIGSLNIYNDYVSLIIPTEDESDAIIKRVKMEIRKEGIEPGSFRFMCAVGGPIKAILKLSRDLGFVNKKERVFSPDVFKLIRDEISSNDKETYSKILKTKPARIHTMIPGLLIIQELCNYFNIDEIQVSKFGVREGYLNYKLGIGI